MDQFSARAGPPDPRTTNAYANAGSDVSYAFSKLRQQQPESQQQQQLSTNRPQWPHLVLRWAHASPASLSNAGTMALVLPTSELRPSDIKHKQPSLTRRMDPLLLPAIGSPPDISGGTARTRLNNTDSNTLSCYTSTGS